MTAPLYAAAALAIIGTAFVIGAFRLAGRADGLDDAGANEGSHDTEALHARSMGIDVERDRAA